MEWTADSKIPEDFFAIPRLVYADDRVWIPEQPVDVAALFHPRHSFFELGQAWVDVIPGKARLAGFIHPDAKVGDEPAAYFGYWEGVDDLAAQFEIFGRFEAWARSKGVSQVMGPINFRTHYSYRLRLDHFDTPPFYPGEPYNPAYYLKLMQALRYEQNGLYHSWFGDAAEIIAATKDALERVMARAESHGLRFMPLTPQYWNDNIEALHEDTRAIFGDNPGFSQISLAEFKKLLGSERIAAMDPRCSVITLGKDGRMVAFMLCFPDWAPLLNQGASPRFLPGQLRYDEHFRLLKNPLLLGKTVGVMPAYRRLGLFEIMCYLTAKASLDDYAHVGTVLIRAGGLSASRAGKVFSLPGCYTHDYGLFGRTLEPV